MRFGCANTTTAVMAANQNVPYTNRALTSKTGMFESTMSVTALLACSVAKFIAKMFINMLIINNTTDRTTDVRKLC